jgi:TonB family protein
MSAEQPAVPPVPSAPGQGVGVVYSGWLATNSVFERPDERRLGRAMGASVLTHVVFAGILMLAMLFKPERVFEPLPTPEYDVVFVHTEGPGGGGGGNPTPAPPQPKPLEIPKPKIEPVPVTPPPQQVTLQQPVVMPQLTAPVYTNNATALMSSGNSSISLSPYGGTGQGRGIGPGRGSGIGPGEGGGFGGGAYRPGSGVTDPTLVRQEPPKYTSEAMRAKIQGVVELEAVVLPNGTIGDVRITKSLDARFGLDQEAIRAARAWLFRPGTLKGEAVPVLVTLILEFRLH